MKKFQELNSFLKDLQIESFNPNSQQILIHHLRYIKLVRDPFKVFQYMEDRKICTALPEYWLQKSEQLFESGEFEKAFSSLVEANNCQYLLQKYPIPNMVFFVNAQKKAQSYLREIVAIAKIFWKPEKRAITEFMTKTTEPFDGLSYLQSGIKYSQLFEILQSDYPMIALKRNEEFQKMNSQKPLSWLSLEKSQLKENVYLKQIKKFI